MDESQNQDLIEVTHVWGLAAADVLKSYLESNGIPCVYKSQVVPFVHVFTTDGMGEIKILVKAEDLEAAKALLAKTDVPPEEPGGPESPKETP